jgi:hypothetical protein
LPFPAVATTLASQLRQKQRRIGMSLDWLSNGSIWMEFLESSGASAISAPFGFVLLRGARMEGGPASQPFAAFDGGYWTLQGEPQRYSSVVGFGVFSVHMEVRGGCEVVLDCVNVSLAGHVLQVDGRAIATLDRQTSRWTRLADGLSLVAIRMEPENRRADAPLELVGTTRCAWPATDRAGRVELEEFALAA